MKTMKAALILLAVSISAAGAWAVEVRDAGVQQGGAGNFSSVTNSGLTSGRVPYSTTGGAQTDDPDMTFNGSTLTVAGPVAFTSNTVIDAYSDSFGAVTAGSTSTVTWTEVVDRNSEFVTSSFTVTLSGLYEVIAHSGVSQTAGNACLIVKKNNASFVGNTVCNQGVTGLASILDVSYARIMNLVAGDVVRVDASATTANATFQKMSLTIKRIP